MIEQGLINQAAHAQGYNIPAVAKFEKVSFEFFLKAIEKHKVTKVGTTSGGKVKQILYDIHNEGDILELKGFYDRTSLPIRGTRFSMGYDFPLLFDYVKIDPNKTIMIPTCIKADMAPGWGMFAMPRSGLGCRLIMLADTLAVIDGDYYNSPKSEGHIFVQLHNFSEESVVIEQTNSFIQGIFLPYGLTIDDSFDQPTRIDGFGSTNPIKIEV